MYFSDTDLDILG